MNDPSPFISIVNGLMIVVAMLANVLLDFEAGEKAQNKA